MMNHASPRCYDRDLFLFTKVSSKLSWTDDTAAVVSYSNTMSDHNRLIFNLFMTTSKIAIGPSSTGGRASCRLHSHWRCRAKSPLKPALNPRPRAIFSGLPLGHDESETSCRNAPPTANQATSISAQSGVQDMESRSCKLQTACRLPQRLSRVLLLQYEYR
jgi:hypothetical protein